jgi:hypothetical protein
MRVGRNARLKSRRTAMLEYLHDIVMRQWNDLLSRPTHVLAFRFVPQPVMAMMLAIRDGLKDARIGRTPYFWAILTNREERGPRLREGLHATLRVIVLALAMDVIYQVLSFGEFYPVEAAIVVFVLAFAPYLLTRGPAARIARSWLAHQSTKRPRTA